MNRKSVVVVLTLIIAVFSATRLSGQDHSIRSFSIGTGLSIPLNDFKSTSTTNAGFAKPGFAFSFDYKRPLISELTWNTSLAVSVNPMDEAALKSEFDAGFGPTMGAGFKGITGISTGKYVIAWPMTGIGSEVETPFGFNIYAAAQAGFMFSSFPEIRFNIGQNSLTQTTSFATAFAMGFEGGITTNRLKVGAKYLYGQPQYEQTIMFLGKRGTSSFKLPANVLVIHAAFLL